MLANSRVTTILTVADSERARDFYANVLGLRDLGRSGDGKVQFASTNGVLALLERPAAPRGENTAISFEVPDAGAAVAELSARGVVFEDYDLPGLKTVAKVCVLGSEKAAWFKDTEGNLLCIHEVVPAASPGR
jgi:catechol 2,3-dioxygenase-like lactoylglutathione lyase family enzyme